jgi:hypothetical protein
MKYLGFYFLTGGVITVSLLLAAFWIHWREIRRISWANTLGLIVMVSIFWPLLILRLTTIPQLLWQLVGLDDSSAAWQATQKARQQALMNPPYCSSLVRFDASSYSDARGAQGVFHFPAEEVERQIKALIMTTKVVCWPGCKTASMTTKGPFQCQGFGLVLYTRSINCYAPASEARTVHHAGRIIRPSSLHAWMRKALRAGITTNSCALPVTCFSDGKGFTS